MDLTYCCTQCITGKAARESFLKINDSVFDAASDFQHFVEKCIKTCPCGQANIKNKDKESY